MHRTALSSFVLWNNQMHPATPYTDSAPGWTRDESLAASPALPSSSSSLLPPFSLTANEAAAYSWAVVRGRRVEAGAPPREGGGVSARERERAHCRRRRRRRRGRGAARRHDRGSREKAWQAKTGREVRCWSPALTEHQQTDAHTSSSAWWALGISEDSQMRTRRGGSQRRGAWVCSCPGGELTHSRTHTHLLTHRQHNRQKKTHTLQRDHGAVSLTTRMGCNLCTLQKREEHYKLLYEIAQVSQTASVSCLVSSCRFQEKGTEQESGGCTL